jgi:hypothetical protein
MRAVVRWWLVLAVLGVVTATASADPRCACRRRITLPRQGATDVPTNARFWTIPSDTPDQPIQSYELQPHTAYELAQQHLSFTTGAGADHTPPIEPGVGNISIQLAPGSVHGLRQVALVRVSANFDADTAVVRFDIRDGDRRIVFYTTPDALSVCDPGFSLSGDDVDIDVVAIDLAGNESSPGGAYAQPVEEAYYAPDCDEHHLRCGTPLIAIVYLAPSIGLIALVVLLLVVAIRSARRRAHAEAEPLSIASAVYLARAVRLRARITLASVAVIGGAASANDAIAVVAFTISPFLAALAIPALVRWAQASRFARLLRYDGVSAEVQGDRVTIVIGGKVAFLRASPKLVERAKRNALPRASL